MNKVVIFGGTTEGRMLAETLADNDVICIYCVATEYGREPIDESSSIHIHSGRMDAEMMVKLYECERPDAIIDATHPYAEVVKAEIDASVSKYERVPFFRIAREEDDLDLRDCTFFESAEGCAKALESTSGTVFLTTGSKELAAFCKNESLRERLVARIIPNEESLEICKTQGLKGNQIVAMQGPFSKRMNVALLKEYQAEILVLKESGKAGGELERIEAARACSARCFIIKRPNTNINAFTYQQVLEHLFKKFDIKPVEVKESLKDAIKVDTKLDVTLAGFGMGFATLTEEVKRAIEEADYIFGAPRMIVGVDTKAKKYPYYLAKDIVPCLTEIAAGISLATKKAVVLFSGDTGFYSGATKLEKALLDLNYCKVRISPGISSISALAAKAKVNWQGANIFSTHGIKLEEWLPQLIQAARFSERTFIITSGAKDVRLIGEKLMELESQYDFRYRIFVGTNLYNDEKLEWLTPEKCSNFDKDGLCTVLVINENYRNKTLAPGITDEEFIRENVPMSKEEIRALSICKLRPCKNAIIYDVGSGSGSVAVELGLLDSSINVYAVELKHEACELIEKNVCKHNLFNVSVVEGTAPEALEGLPVPTHVFIGGSAKRLDEIITHLESFNSQIRIVINAVTFETIAEINMMLKNHGIENADIVQVSVSKAKKAGEYHVMQGQNPVYVVSFNI